MSTTEIIEAPKPIDTAKHFDIIASPSQKLGARMHSVRQVILAQAETIFLGLPRHIKRGYMERAFLTCIRKNPKLLDCHPASLFASLTEASELGLMLDNILGHAYLVPFKKECVLIPGYKGLIDLARRSSEISFIKTQVVREGDPFLWEEGTDPVLKHTPSSDPAREEKAMTHAYLIARMRDHETYFNCWPLSRIIAHRNRFSKGYQKAERDRTKDSPWHTDFESMARKTVIRESINRGELPVSVEVQALAARDELVEREADIFGGGMGVSQPMRLNDLMDQYAGNGGGADQESDREPQQPTSDDPFSDALGKIKRARTPETVDQRLQEAVKAFPDEESRFDLEKAAEERLEELERSQD